MDSKKCTGKALGVDADAHFRHFGPRQCSEKDLSEDRTNEK